MTKRTKKVEYQQFENVWDALCDTPEEAANLTTRSELMIQITQIVKKCGWTQAEAAKRCRITQPRMNDLLRGRTVASHSTRSSTLPPPSAAKSNSNSKQLSEFPVPARPRSVLL